MEKAIEIIARYHYKQEYFVEVTHEKSVLANRDYWLCKKNSPKKVFMFSSPFENEKREELLIKSRIQAEIEKFEQRKAQNLTA